MSKGGSDEAKYPRCAEKTAFLREGGDPRGVKLTSLCLHFPICNAGSCLGDAGAITDERCGCPGDRYPVSKPPAPESWSHGLGARGTALSLQTV